MNIILRSYQNSAFDRASLSALLAQTPGLALVFAAFLRHDGLQTVRLSHRPYRLA